MVVEFDLNLCMFKHIFCPFNIVYMCVCVCVCVCARARARVCVCVCVFGVYVFV